jgi:hypothetical protein
MIKKILAGCGPLFVYFCIATIITQVILVGYLAAAWQIDGTKMVQMLAIARGVDLFAMKEEADHHRDEVSKEQTSYDEVLQARALDVHYLQLREQALKDGLGQLQFKQRKVLEDKGRFDEVIAAFEERLKSVEGGAIATGMDAIRVPLEAIKPTQTKKLLVEMIENDEMDVVVSLLSAMPSSKSAKIMGEFKTPEETVLLSEILRRMRQGVPIATLVQETENQLAQPTRLQP